MLLNNTFELSLVLDSEKFHKVLTWANHNTEYFDDNEDEYVDQFLASKGITVIYRNSRYKKKVKLIVNQSLILDSKEFDPDKFIRKLKKRIDLYFNCHYRLDDFSLTGLVLATDMDVHTHEKVSEYLKVLQRVGKVRGFSPSSFECFDDDASFCLEGNSNGIDFLVYDLEGLLKNQLRNTNTNRKKLKIMVEESKGVLRVEVRLTEPKAIRAYTDKSDTSKQVAALSEIAADIFLDTFTQVIPFGDFHKKDKAVEIIRDEVKDNTLKRKMLYLLQLIPEKKSLLLAQKALNYRRIDDVMEAFAAVCLSPVTLSKRQDVKQLKSLYCYLFDEK